MGEMLLGELRKDVPLVILRPSMVTSTYKEPFPGWIENLRTFDTVPIDMVVNAMIVAMAAHVNHPNSGIIYHGTSSASNPVKLHQIVDWSVEYFTKHPYINKDGSIKPRDFKLLTSDRSFQKYISIHYKLPLKVCIAIHYKLPLKVC
ncbi:putative alcohol-forming fatty acyl-CoA reductase [Helianthus annuus]|nr:putative alcohol-forming fatty acyl-CoA reductase [Helianthus annuus]